MGNDYPKSEMDSLLGAMRSLSDSMREALQSVDARILGTMTSADDDEICYTELWLRQIRERVQELDKHVGRVRQLNWKRALHLWYGREQLVKKYGHKFRLDFHLIPGLPKEATKERGELIEWLKAGGRMDCLVMDEHSGEWVFDFKKMEQLINQMISEGNRPPECVKLHPQPKIVVQVDK